MVSKSSLAKVERDQLCSTLVVVVFADYFVYRTRAIKGRGFYSKNIFWTYALWCVSPKIVHSYILKIKKIKKNAPILSRYKRWVYNSRAFFIGAGRHRLLYTWTEDWIIVLPNSIPAKSAKYVFTNICRYSKDMTFHKILRV